MAQVDVLMAVYNAMPYLPEAVDSILTQTFQDFKFLIINDGSEDGSEEYLNQLDDPRVHLVHRPHQGRSAARNFGLAMCDGEFIAIMDSDDVALPTRLEAQLNFLRCHREVGLVGTQYEYLGLGGRRGFSPPLPCDHETIYATLLRRPAGMINATIMCRTSVLKRIAGSSIDANGEDWDRMFLRMGEVTRLANLKEVLYRQRLHSNSIMATKLAEIWMQHAYASDCAERRGEGQPEITFDEFLIQQRARPFWRQTLEVMDCYAFGQYRRAVAEILSPHWAVGYARLAWAALSSPRLTSQRVSRAIRKRWMT